MLFGWTHDGRTRLAIKSRTGERVDDRLDERLGGSRRREVVVVVSERVPADVRVEEVNRPVQLWAEARFTLTRLFEGRGLVGERYLLTNVSEQPMVLAEAEFDRADGQVLAVAIETHNLRPADSTSVYVIRLGG